MTDARTFQVARCALTVGAEPWPFAERHKDAIAAHWRKCQIARPKLFDGTIYLTRSFALEHGALAGTLVRTDFKTFLYWRECGGGDDQGVRDGFGAAVIRSAEGYVLLGRQSEGNLNAGLAYPPSGMIDARDVTDGAVDIEASIVRELREETGLEASELARAPGFVRHAVREHRRDCDRVAQRSAGRGATRAHRCVHPPPGCSRARRYRDHALARRDRRLPHAPICRDAAADVAACLTVSAIWAECASPELDRPMEAGCPHNQGRFGSHS